MADFHAIFPCPVTLTVATNLKMALNSLKELGF